MRVSRLLVVMPALIVLALAGGACKKKSTLPQPSQQAFDTAPAEIKDMWTQALEADKTNDFYKAEVLLYEIVRRNPDPAQVQAARDELVVVHTRLKDLVTKGDPTAKAAFDQMRANPPSRPQGASPQ